MELLRGVVSAGWVGAAGVEHLPPEVLFHIVEL
jgi:hypothetical protein